MGKILSDRATGADSLREEQRLRNSQKMNLAVGAAIPSFGDESRSNQVLPIKITNSHTADQLIAIFPGELESISEITKILGITVDGIAAEGEFITDKASCVTKQGTTMGYIQKFVTRNPTRVLRLQVSSTSEEQLNEPLVFGHINPFAKAGEQVLTPSAYKKETNMNSKLVTISPKDIQLDDQTVMYVNVLAGATLTLSITVGATSNAAATLAKQAEILLG